MKREPFIAHSKLTNEIYIVSGREKYLVTEQAVKAVKAIKALEQDPCGDCISRTEAIKCLECDFDITGKENMKTVVNYINSAHNKIVNLPSVKQEPTTKNDLGVSSGHEKNSQKLEKDFGELDCISRDAVMYYIKAHIHEIITESGIDKNARTNAMLRSLLNGVKTMPSVTPQEPRWIPVSERLPKPNAKDGLTARYYLIRNEYEDMLVARYDGMGWQQMYQHEYLEDDVIAWMPLPKPYKAESEQ